MILYSRILGNHSHHLLIFHGLFGMSDNWNTLAQKFAEYFTVHTLDLRNHGQSFHEQEMSYQTMSDDILNYINHYEINDFSLLGHSLGGKAVMEFALTQPTEKLKKLVVADMSQKAYPPHHQGIIKALASVDFSIIHSRSKVEQQLKKYISEQGVIQFLMKNLYWNDEKKLGFRFNLSAIQNNYDRLINNTNSFGTFEKPTLFLAGEKSNYILPQDEFIIKKQFPNANILKIKNAGHWLHADNPTEFFEKSLAFLLK